MATAGDEHLKRLRDQRHQQMRERVGGYRPPKPGTIPQTPRPKLTKQPLRVTGEQDLAP
jgi:hypothetical protein